MKFDWNKFYKVIIRLVVIVTFYLAVNQIFFYNSLPTPTPIINLIFLGFSIGLAKMLCDSIREKKISNPRYVQEVYHWKKDKLGYVVSFIINLIIWLIYTGYIILSTYWFIDSLF